MHHGHHQRLHAYAATGAAVPGSLEPRGDTPPPGLLGELGDSAPPGL